MRDAHFSLLYVGLDALSVFQNKGRMVTDGPQVAQLLCELLTLPLDIDDDEHSPALVGRSYFTRRGDCENGTAQARS